MLTFEIMGDKAVIAKIDNMSSTIRAALRKKITALTIKLDLHVVDDKLTGQVLNRISGALARSINWLVTEEGEAVIGKVRSSGDVKYAAIHEFGGVIHHPGGTAYVVIGGRSVFVSNAKAAVMQVTGRTAPHDITIPKRSFLRSALADMKDEVVAGIKTAVTEGMSLR